MMPPVFPGLQNWNPQPFVERLRRLGYTAEGMQQLPDLISSAYTMETMAATRASLLAVPSRLGTAIRLFRLEDQLELPDAIDLLGEFLHELSQIGLIEALDGKVRARFRLSPVEGCYLVSDFPSRQLDPAGDYVMGYSPSTRQLAALTPPIFPCRALELGCGFGWLARQLAAAGASVTATDINPRAIELARINAKLTGIESVDYRQGSLFEPVAGEQPFDLIVSNPPYVQSPGGSMVYLESESPASICKQLVTELPAHLAPGGIGVVLINWGHASETDWSDEPLSWVEDKALQTWLFQIDCAPPAEYAWRWIQHDPRFSTAAAIEAETRRWLEHYRRNGIRRLSAGFIAVRRPLADDEPTWTRTDSRAAGNLTDQAGRDILRVFFNETWLRKRREEPAPSSLLDTAFTVPDGLTAALGLRLDAGWDRQTIRLRSPGSLPYDGQIDETLLRLIALCREGKPPRAMLDELLAQARSRETPDLSRRIEELVTQLVRHGILLPPFTGETLAAGHSLRAERTVTTHSHST